MVTPNCRQMCSGCGARSFGGGVCFEEHDPTAGKAYANVRPAVIPGADEMNSQSSDPGQDKMDGRSPDPGQDELNRQSADPGTDAEDQMNEERDGEES